MGTLTPFAAIVLVVLAIVLGVFAVVFLLVPVCKFLWQVVLHLARFVGGEVVDALRLVGSIITAIVMVPLTLLNVIVGRWSGAAHYGRGFTGEVKNAGLCIYRMAIGHPARLLGLSALTEGVEQRLPAVVANAPGSDTPSKRVGQFPGYTIVGSLPGGGSGGKLYVAEPDATKKAVFARSGRADVDQVVIKVFSLKDGSSLPQIVRESRSLDAAKNLGLVLDHELTPERFFYVMEYVPGQSLSLVTQQLHAASGPGGLDADRLRSVAGYSIDLLRTLEQYHRGGLWHKDVKPDNIIVDGERARLVDFGLITPLASAMTLTTHGTEYFRDPELVRMALRGAKVHEVDGTRFDIYAAGAVLYSIIENSFPAHGVLSQITKKCPEAMRWVVRRAMTDYDKRYATAAEMAADLEFVRFSSDPFAIKPIELPSMRGGSSVDAEPSVQVDPEVAAMGAAAAANGWGSVAQQARKVAADASRLAADAVQGAMSAAGIAGVKAVDRKAPRLRVTNWWTGAYVPDGEQPIAEQRAGSPVPPRAAPFVAGIAMGKAFASVKVGIVRRPAAEQLARARGRAQAARQRITDRLEHRGVRTKARYSNGVNPGVWVAAIAVPVVLGVIIYNASQDDAADALVSESSREVSVADDGSLWAQADLPAIDESDESAVFESPDAPATPRTPEPTVTRASARTVQTGVIEIGAPKTSAPRALPEPSVYSDGKVLLVVDLAKPLSREQRTAISSVASRLSRVGFSLIGDYPGNASGADAMGEQLGITADVLARCAGVASDTPEIRARLSQWLAENPDKANLVVWFRHQAQNAESPVRCFLAGPGFDPETPKFDEASRRFAAGVEALR